MANLLPNIGTSKMGFKKEELKTLLENNAVVVHFTKVDGSARTMRCSLSSMQMPAIQHQNYVAGDYTDANHISVWDFDKDAWRSFRIDSVITVELL